MLNAHLPKRTTKYNFFPSLYTFVTQKLQLTKWNTYKTVLIT
jgi:hypothetical protein